MDWKLSSDFTNQRMHHPNGLQELLSQIRGKMPTPTDEEMDTEGGYREFLHLTQVEVGNKLI